MTKSWIDAIGNHMWRFYFSRPDADPSGMEPSNRAQWEACHRAMNRYNRTAQDIMRSYYTCEWGHDLHAMDAYSARTGITTDRIRFIIHSANRAAAEERGLIDRRRAE